MTEKKNESISIDADELGNVIAKIILEHRPFIQETMKRPALTEALNKSLAQAKTARDRKEIVADMTIACISEFVRVYLMDIVKKKLTNHYKASAAVEEVMTETITRITRRTPGGGMHAAGEKIDL